MTYAPFHITNELCHLISAITICITAEIPTIVSITYDAAKPGEFVEKGFQYGFPNVVLYVWTKKGKDGKLYYDRSLQMQCVEAAVSYEREHALGAVGERGGVLCVDECVCDKKRAARQASVWRIL